MMEVTSMDLRPLYRQAEGVKQANSEIMIVTMDPEEGGEYLKAVNIHYHTAAISMMVGTNSAFIYDDNYYFGTYSKGFKTKLNHVSSSNYDSHLFKFDPDSETDYKKSNCFYLNETSGSDV